MDTACAPRQPPTGRDDRIGLLASFASPAVEDAFRQRHFREDRWVSCFLVGAAAARVALFLLVDYQDFGAGPAFWPLLLSRLVFLVVSAGVVVALRNAASPGVADRVFFGWALCLVAVTVAALTAGPPRQSGLLMMSFGPVLVAYCVIPLRLSGQALLALLYSAAVLSGVSWPDGETLAMVGGVHSLSHGFGAVMSWRLNRRRREAFVGSLREADLRAGLETAVAAIRTLRGFLCICAWCKRVRDEAQAWEPVETYVQSRTDAAFTHGICPDCLQSQQRELARLRP